MLRDHQKRRSWWKTNSPWSTANLCLSLRNLARGEELFRKVLIANRGEIALRIIRACQELDIRTVAIYSEADADSLHVAYADEAYCVGPAPSSQSYLNIPNIISSALILRGRRHPSWIWVSGRTGPFCRNLLANGLAFIGPSPETIERMGDKARSEEGHGGGGRARHPWKSGRCGKRPGGGWYCPGDWLSGYRQSAAGGGERDEGGL